MKITANESTKLNENMRTGETGVALVASILALLLVTLLGISIVTVGLTSRTVASNDRETTEAFFVAEAGMSHALRIIAAQGQANFSKVLKNGNNGVLCDELINGDEINNIADPIPPAGASLPNIPGNSYIVCVTDDLDEGTNPNNPLDDKNGRIIVRSLGVGRNFATTTLEGLFGALPAPGLLVDGQLRISGNPDFIGLGGAVHANGTIDFDGNPCAQQYFSSASNIVDPGNAETGPGCAGNNVLPSQPILPVPDYNPSEWAIRADIPDPDMIFRSDGVVLKKIGVTTNVTTTIILPGAYITANVPAGYVVAGAACSSLPCSSGDFKENPAAGEVQWSFDGGVNKKEWVFGGNNMVGGRTYYFQGSNMTIGGGPGSAGSPVTATFMADGYIQIAGNPWLQPNALNPDVQMMAGTDLKLNGNASGSNNNFRGLHFARHQINISGNPRISGRVVAKNLADTRFPGASGENLIQLSSGFMVISGNPTINYDGGANATDLRFLNWREVRN